MHSGLLIYTDLMDVTNKKNSFKILFIILNDKTVIYKHGYYIR